MNFTIDLNTLFITIVGGGVGWVLKGVSAIKADLRALNGRLGKVETWQENHEKLDDERASLIRGDMKDAWAAIRHLEEKKEE